MCANQLSRLMSIGLLCAGLVSGLPAIAAGEEEKGAEAASRYEQQMKELAESEAPYREGSEDVCRDAAKKGEPVAMLVLAQRLLSERDSSEECPEAIEWLTRAADKNFTPAIQWLGICHYHAFGTPEDNSKAVACFRRAADAGFIQSFHLLGLCYHGGHGVEQDLQQACQMFRKAAEAGDPESAFLLGVYLSEGIAGTQDQKEAIRWWERAAAAGHLLAVNNLGVAYLDGKGVAVDKTKAIARFREGAAQGNSHCQYNLGRCYRDGIGVIQNYDTAEEWLDKAAAQKLQPAVEMLAELRSVRAAARAEASSLLFGRPNSNPIFPGQPSDAQEAARRQMRDYQYQIGGGSPW